MMQQYEQAKQACPGALLLFRMGDFYELFGEDAKVAARALGLALTSRDKGNDGLPMAGFPHHQLDNYLGKLIAAGHRAAVCEQVEDPKKAKGLVKREVVRIVSPGTVTDEALLDPRESNYLAAIVEGTKSSPVCGLAWVELSTGRFTAMGLSSSEIIDQIARIGPAECLIDEQAPALPDHLTEEMMVTRRPGWAFGMKSAREALTRHFETADLDGFGFEENEYDDQAIRAAGAVLDYLLETQKSSLDHVELLLPYRATGVLEIDESSRRSLEISRTLRDGRREGSLLGVLDQTVTAMGGRLLADWIGSPLTDLTRIVARHEAIEELLNASSLTDELRESLRRIYDLERLVARVTTGRASPRDLCFIGRTLSHLPAIKTKLEGRSAPLLQLLQSELDLCEDLRDRIIESLEDDCPLSPRDGGFVREGFDPKLDELRGLTQGGRQWIAEYQSREGERTEIPNLKVGFNKVFGYYIEITNAHKDKVPPEYVRKQTLKNAERYITPELKTYEEKVLTAEEKAKDLEYDIYLELRDLAAAARSRLQATGRILGQIDVMVALAELARARNYCRPKMIDSPNLHIVDGRHPVLDVMLPDGTFVPNDTAIGLFDPSLQSADPLAVDAQEDAEEIDPAAPHPAEQRVDTMADRDATIELKPSDERILLITGPNMAGKSTYIRQVALITLMAQIGSFVPASRATIGIADRIFARVGASDQLSRGRSTFMVEMTETARILNTATPRSLVILDEIGRGTSTYDGMSLAWAVIEHLQSNIGARTLFATHYHELTDLELSLEGVKNLNVAVREWQDDVIFLHKIVNGAADKSYGIHVARLAGVPRDVVKRAQTILGQLEEEHHDESGRAKIALPSPAEPGSSIQLTLFGPADDPIFKEIRDLDIDDTTPLAALKLIARWQRELR